MLAYSQMKCVNSYIYIYIYVCVWIYISLRLAVWLLTGAAAVKVGGEGASDRPRISFSNSLNFSNRRCCCLPYNNCSCFGLPYNNCRKWTLVVEEFCNIYCVLRTTRSFLFLITSLEPLFTVSVADPDCDIDAFGFRQCFLFLNGWIQIIFSIQI